MEDLGDVGDGDAVVEGDLDFVGFDGELAGAEGTLGDEESSGVGGGCRGECDDRGQQGGGDEGLGMSCHGMLLLSTVTKRAVKQGVEGIVLAIGEG